MMSNENRDWLANLPPYPARSPEAAQPGTPVPGPATEAIPAQLDPAQPDPAQSNPTAAIPTSRPAAEGLPQPSVAAPTWTGFDPVHPANTWGVAAVNAPLRKRSVPKTATIVGVAAAVLIGGSVAAYAAGKPATEATATASQNAGTDAGTDDGGSLGPGTPGGTGTEGGTGTDGGEGFAGPGQGDAGGTLGQGGPRGGGMLGMSGGSTLHGEYVVENDGDYVTMATQTGEVTAVSDDSITLTSDDGFVRTYTLSGDTVVRGLSRGSTASAQVEAGAVVGIAATKSGDGYKATTLLVSGAASSGSSSGSSTGSSSGTSTDGADADGSAASSATGAGGSA